MGGLIGRDRELRILRDRLADRSGALLVSGEPGIGKTALVEEFGLGAGRCLRTAGQPDESHFPFAGLHQLLADRLDDLSAVPVARRQALLAAFGLAEATGPQPFLIGLAMLDLLVAAGPLVLIVEDAHWLDRETAEILGFLSRRLAGEPILLLATARPGYRNALIDAIGDTLTVGPLAGEAAAAVLDRVAPHASAETRSQVRQWAAGNPLALIELARAGQPATTRLNQAFTTRSLALPAPLRAALLLAALDAQATLSQVEGAATAMAGAVADLDPAVEAGLIRLDGDRLVFRHALVRAAVLEEAGGERRRQAHGAWAEALTGEPDRRAWHRAEERTYHVVRYTRMPRGGHFAPHDEPDLLAEDIAAFFHPLR